MEGLSTISKTIKTNKKKAIQRKIIEVQLSLEDIIDNAKEIITYIERDNHISEINQNMFNNLQFLIYRQHHLIHVILDHMNDSNMEEIMKLFAPNIRRNILELVHIKMGFIEEVLRSISNHKNYKILNNKMTITIQPELLDWNHEKFINNGHQYLRSFDKNDKKSDIVISEHLPEQRKVVDALVQCSMELSVFINEQIGLEEFFGIKDTKSN
jgi:hypothetical protein